MFNGYLALGGIEIANTERARGYAESSECNFSWLRGPRCETLAEALGHDEYRVDGIGEAPWYDPTRADVSSRFYGVSLIDLEGRYDSTRSVNVTQSLGDGGVIGDSRNATKELRAKAFLLASGEDALDYGLNWLISALEPGACGQHGTACGLADLRFFTTCPPELDYLWDSEDGDVVATNLFTNPRLAGSSTWEVVRRNLIVQPNISASASRWYMNSSFFAQEAVSGGRKLTATVTVPADEYVIKLNPAYVISGSVGNVYSMACEVQNTGSAPVNVKPALQFGGTAISEGGAVTIAPGESAILKHSQTQSASGGVNPHVRLDQALPAGGSLVVRDGITLESGGVPRGPFSGSSMDITMTQPEDFRARWVGTVNNSQSVIEIETVNGFTGANAIAGKSTWGGRPAVRIIPTTSDPTQSPYVSFAVPAEAHAGGTLIGKLNLNEATAPAGQPLARRLGAYSPEQLSAETTYSAGSNAHRLTFSALSATYEARLYSGSLAGGDSWWTDLGVFAGAYEGEAFSGGTVDAGARPAFGYRWTGAADASKSEKFELLWTSTPDYDGYAPKLRQVERFMHDVAVTSPPSVRELFATSTDPKGPKGALVEFNVTSERGFIYSRPVNVPLLTIADAYEDTQRNLFLNPTTDYPGPVQVLRRNLVPNPSLESAVTGWGIAGVEDSTELPVSVTGGRVSNELRISGTYSMKAVMPAVSGDKGRAYITYLRAVPASGRFVKIGIWGGVTDPSSVVTDLHAEYSLDNGMTWQLLANAPSVAAARSGFSYKGANYIELPATATANIGIRFVAIGTAGFTAYADAAMVIEG